MNKVKSAFKLATSFIQGIQIKQGVPAASLLNYQYTSVSCPLRKLSVRKDSAQFAWFTEHTARTFVVVRVGVL